MSGPLSIGSEIAPSIDLVAFSIDVRIVMMGFLATSHPQRPIEAAGFRLRTILFRKIRTLVTHRAAPYAPANKTGGGSLKKKIAIALAFAPALILAAQAQDAARPANDTLTAREIAPKMPPPVAGF